MIEFQSEEIERLQAEIARRLGYRLVDHRLELYALRWTTIFWPLVFNCPEKPLNPRRHRWALLAVANVPRL